ncbi:MAG TPA: hypothetical protein VGF99_00005, partial [Myxococcota bacterium]
MSPAMSVPRGRRQQRGFALPLVLVVLTIVAMSVLSVSYVLEASAAEAGRIIGDLRGSAACDAMASTAAAIVQERLRNTPSSTTDELTAAVCGEAGGCVVNTSSRRVPEGIATDGTTLIDFFVGYVDEGVPIGIRPIPTGGFVNLLAEERLLGIYVVGRDNRSGRECRTEEDLTIATLSPLQFNVFVEPEGHLPRPLTVNGSGTTRAHHNAKLTGAVFPSSTKTDADDAHLAPGIVPPPMFGENAGTATSMRFVIDPAAGGDTSDVAAKRLAHLADLRIIDGVWYLRDDTLPWPGKPIWSDHPGSNVQHRAAAAVLVGGSNKIGQSDLFSGARPTRYSLYETDSAGHLDDDNGGIISYGAMKATTNGAVPALWPSFPSGGATDICGGTGDFVSVADCGGSKEAALLEGTRAGFEHDGENILPINFNVEALAEALQDGNAGELGSHFPVGGANPRQFNGIVWITQTWKGSAGGGSLVLERPAQGDNNGDEGYGPARGCGPAPAPVIGGEGGGAPVAPPGGATPPAGGPCSAGTPGTTARAQASVPATLCGGAALDGTTTAPGFKIPSCSNASLWGSSGGEGAMPNAVRIVRAGQVDPRFFPGGLTIATNLPMYVQGYVNSTELSTDVERRKVLFAADRITILSAQFSDGSRPWNTSTPPGQAGDAVIVASLLTGMPKSGKLEQVFRAAEQWRDGYAVVKGSIAVGWYSQFDTKEGDVVGLGKGLALHNDKHLRDPLLQPPGVPRVVAGVTARWRR